MTLKCTQEEYDLLVAPTLYANTKPTKTRTSEDRAKEIALGTAQQKLDKANDLHDIEIETAKLKAKNLALQVEARELEVQKKRLINEALAAQQNVQHTPHIDPVACGAAIVALVMFFGLILI